MGTSKETHIPLIFLTLLYITFGLLERPPFSIELWYPYDSYWVDIQGSWGFMCMWP